MATVTDIVSVYSISIPGLKFNVHSSESIEQCKSSILKQLNIKANLNQVRLYQESIELKNNALVKKNLQNILRLYVVHPIPVIVRVEGSEESIIGINQLDTTADLLEMVSSSEKSLYCVHRDNKLLISGKKIYPRHMETLEIKRDITLEPIHFIFPMDLSRSRRREHIPFVDQMVKMGDNESIICLIVSRDTKELHQLFTTKLHLRGKRDLLELVPICEGEDDKKIYRAQLKPSTCVLQTGYNGGTYLLEYNTTIKEVLGQQQVDYCTIQEENSLADISPDATVGELVKQFSSSILSLLVKANPNKTMRIFYESIARKTVALQVNPASTICEIKGQIQTMEGHSADETRLIFSGLDLHDDHTLFDYNIQKESTLRMALRLVGGDSMNCSFVDISNKKGIEKIQWNDHAPKWRRSNTRSHSRRQV